VENSNGPDDEITIDPLPTPYIPVPRAVAVIARRIPREWRLGNGQRLTWQGWLLAAIAAFVVIGALKLAGVIWMSAPPKWVTTLGTGVTVTGPEQLAPGHGSPGAALTGLMAALSAKDPARSCGYIFMGPHAAVRYSPVKARGMSSRTACPSRSVTWRSAERARWSASLARSAGQALRPNV
jgi:hypothetical protein